MTIDFERFWLQYGTSSLTSEKTGCRSQKEEYQLYYPRWEAFQIEGPLVAWYHRLQGCFTRYLRKSRGPPRLRDFFFLTQCLRVLPVQ